MKSVSLKPGIVTFEKKWSVPYPHSVIILIVFIEKQMKYTLTIKKNTLSLKIS